MKKLVLIIFFVLIQTSFAQWEPSKNGVQCNDISCINFENNNTYTDKTGDLIMSADYGDYWFTKNNIISNLRVHSLAMNGNNIYNGTENEQVFLSTNNGDEWKFIGLQNSTTNTLMIIIGNNVFLGGHGVYLSTDSGNNWTERNSGLIYLGEPCLIISGDYIFAGTNNRGIFRAKLSDLGISDVKDTYTRIKYTIYPNPASNEFSLRFNSPIETIVQINIFDNLGKEVYSRTEQAGKGTNEKIINTEKLSSGYYYIKIKTNEIVQTIPLVIVK